MSKCSQTHPATYNNYGSYLRSRGYDKEICNLIFDIQNGNIPLKKITVDPGIGQLTLTGLNITNTGTYSNLTVAGVQRFTGLDVSGTAGIKGPLNVYGTAVGNNHDLIAGKASITTLSVGDIKNYNNTSHSILGDVNMHKLNIGYTVPATTSSPAVDLPGHLTVTGNVVAKFNNITPGSGPGAGKSIDCAGDVYARTLKLTSSLRYKNNVKNMDLSQAKKLLKIDAVNFEYKHIPGIPQIGVIAEHLHENDLKEYVTYNEKNEPDAVNYIAMINPLIEIVKDLTNRIEALESINATLRKKLE